MSASKKRKSRNYELKINPTLVIADKSGVPGVLDLSGFKYCTTAENTLHKKLILKIGYDSGVDAI